MAIHTPKNLSSLPSSCSLQRYLNQVDTVTLRDGTIKLGRISDGTKYEREEIIINYKPHTIILPTTEAAIQVRKDNGFLDNIQVYKKYFYPSGKVMLKEIRPTLDRTRKAQIIILNSRTYINALIKAAVDMEAKRLFGDASPVIPWGYEYNHRLAGGLGLPEVFGPDAGEFIPKEQNTLHWTLVRQIMKKTGLKISLPGFHDQAYRLLGKQVITDNDVLELGYIDRGDYIEIPESDQYRWCVSEFKAEGYVWVRPLFYTTPFSHVFGTAGSIPYELDTYQDAMNLACSLGYSVIRESLEIE